MGLKVFEIIFDNVSACYTSRQTITGTVVLCIEKKLTFSDIYIKFIGKAKVHWTETDSDGDTTTSTSYSANEVYFQHSVSVGNFSGNKSNELTPGTYTFPFSFSLPQAIPSSFKGQHGQVSYKTKAIIHRKWKFNYKYEVPFIVHTIVDLNSNEAAMQPRQTVVSKNLGLLSSKPLTVKIWLDRTGYVPGETILFSADVTCSSDKEFDGSKIKLVQEVTYFATTKKRTVHEVLHRCSRGSFRHHELWDKYPILVPEIPPSELPHCKIINIDYYLEFTLQTGLLHRNVKLKLPIIIGTIPLQSFGRNLNFNTGPWDQHYPK